MVRKSLSKYQTYQNYKENMNKLHFWQISHVIVLKQPNNLYINSFIMKVFSYLVLLL